MAGGPARLRGRTPSAIVTAITSSKEAPVSEPTPANHVHRSSDHPIYAELHQTEEFAQLRRRFRGFVFPATVAFMVWYLLYVVMSNWATGFMNTQVIGHINVALIFGLLQFASTFFLAWLYGRYMFRRVDPLARELEARYDAEIASGGDAR
jgi:uncharacterized membrane protein (DUF485 family)